MKQQWLFKWSLSLSACTWDDHSKVTPQGKSHLSLNNNTRSTFCCHTIICMQQGGFPSYNNVKTLLLQCPCMQHLLGSHFYTTIVHAKDHSKQKTLKVMINCCKIHQKHDSFWIYWYDWILILYPLKIYASRKFVFKNTHYIKILFLDSIIK